MTAVWLNCSAPVKLSRKKQADWFYAKEGRFELPSGQVLTLHGQGDEPVTVEVQALAASHERSVIANGTVLIGGDRRCFALARDSHLVVAER